MHLFWLHSIANPWFSPTVSHCCGFTQPCRTISCNIQRTRSCSARQLHTIKMKQEQRLEITSQRPEWEKQQRVWWQNQWIVGEALIKGIIYWLRGSLYSHHHWCWIGFHSKFWWFEEKNSTSSYLVLSLNKYPHIKTRPNSKINRTSHCFHGSLYEFMAQNYCKFN